MAKKSIEAKEKTEESPEELKSPKQSLPDPKKEEALKAEFEVKYRVSEALSNLENSALSDDLLNEMSLLVKESVKLQESKHREEIRKVVVLKLPISQKEIFQGTCLSSLFFFLFSAL